jgi:hypothetical protein
MSVCPVTFNADGSIDVICDETGHSGTISAAEVVWGTKIDGSPDHTAIVLNCPDGCGTSSTHPAGGGAAPAEVQEMFVRKVDLEGCCCDEPMNRSTEAAVDHVKGLVEAMDGPDRWQVDEQALAESLRK